jgi:hypothetical protein
MSATVIIGDISPSTPVALAGDPIFEEMKSAGVELHKLLVARVKDLGKSRAKATVACKKIATQIRDTLKKFNSVVEKETCPVSHITLYLWELRMYLREDTINTITSTPPFSFSETGDINEYNERFRTLSYTLINCVSSIFGT